MAEKARTSSQRPTIASLQKLVRDLEREGESRATRIAELEQAESFAIVGLRAKNTELEAQLTGMGQELEAANERARQAEMSRATWKGNAEVVGKERDAALIENDNLRHELHRLEVDKARLEGHLERIHEFDPVTEQKRYRDGIQSIDAWDGNRNMVGESPRPGAWYLRRAG